MVGIRQRLSAARPHAELFPIRRHALGALVLAALVLGLVLAYQRAWTINLNIGRDEGYANDTPFVRGFYDPEKTADGLRYRWTSLDAALEFANLPARPYLISLTQISGEPATVGGSGGAAFRLEAGRTLHLLAVPEQGRLLVPIRVSQAVDAPGDQRTLGAALTGGRLSAVAGWAPPPAAPLLAWSLAMAALWLVVWGLGGGLIEAVLACGLLGAGAIAATVAAPERASLAAGAIVQTTLYGLAFAAIASRVFPRIIGWLEGGAAAAEPDRAEQAAYLRWLILAATAVWALKLGGRLLPGSMPGDIGFHRNRVWMMMGGQMYNPSLHRGVPFPYPPALYALVAPLTMTGLSPEWLLQLAAAACEALALPFIFGLGRRATGSARAGLIAAVLYGIFPAGFMTTAWSFDSHIFAQFLTVVWSAALVRWWGRWHERRHWLALAGGLTLIGLSHFGFYINTSLLAGLLAGGRWLVAGGRRAAAAERQAERRQGLGLGMALIAAQVVVWGLYYSAFLALFIKQGSSVAAGGVDAINNRPLLPRDELLWDTLTTGFWRHYALLPLLLAPFGLARLWRSERGRPAAILIAATFAVSLALGALPIITGAPLTTRWLMFSAWGLALVAGAALDWLARRVRWGRWAAVACTLFVAGWGLSLWIEAVVYRIRPPEPF
jgi:hypothetical protein